MNLANLAVRNLMRNWQRSLVTGLSMAFATMIMVIFVALIEGMLLSFERNAVTMSVGEIQIHQQGYRDDPDLYKRVILDAAAEMAIEENGLFYSERLYGFALAAAGTSSAGIQLRGINPEQEKRVTQIHQHIHQGQWLNSHAPYGVVIGKKLARTLDVKIGNEVIILSQASDGSMADALFEVRGILKSVGEEIDRSGFYILDTTFRELMIVAEGSHEIALQRKNTDDELIAKTIALEKEISQLQPQWEVNGWRQILPLIARTLEASDGQMFFLILITYIAVAMIVLNSMLMSVFERLREFGVMKALGVSPTQLLALIYIESIILATLASVMGAVTGIMMSLYFYHNGIDLTTLSSGASIAGIAMDPIWRAELTWSAITLPVGFLFVMVLIAVIYPAFKAAIIKPVEAINYR